MKKAFYLGLILFGVFLSCKKEASVKTNSEDNSFNIRTPPPCAPDCGGSGTYTDLELENMGKQVGCHLAQMKRYDIYNSTVSQTDVSEIYKEGVRIGWIECFSHGAPADQPDFDPYTGVVCRQITSVVTSDGVTVSVITQTVCSVPQ